CDSYLRTPVGAQIWRTLNVAGSTFRIGHCHGSPRQGARSDSDDLRRRGWACSLSLQPRLLRPGNELPDCSYRADKAPVPAFLPSEVGFEIGHPSRHRAERQTLSESRTPDST